MNLTFNGIDMGEVTSVKELAVTPVVDGETGEPLYLRVRLEATLAVDVPGPGEVSGG
jgi:hypothetical protein